LQAVFKFSDTDNRLVNKELSIYDDELNKSLKVSVPGLVLTAAGDLVTSAAPVGADERISTAGRHRLLVRPSPFNVSIIFRPYVAFISTVKDVIPAGFAEESENFGSVLDNFVVRVYLPQLEEKVTSLFQVAITGETRSYPCFLMVQEAESGLSVLGVDAFERERSPAETAGLPIAKVSSLGLHCPNTIFCLNQSILPVLRPSDGYSEQPLRHARHYTVQQGRL
jgi:hypothetical protein